MVKRNLIIIAIFSLAFVLTGAALGQNNQRRQSITKPKITKNTKRKSRAAADHPLMDDWARKKPTRKSKVKNGIKRRRTHN